MGLGGGFATMIGNAAGPIFSLIESTKPNDTFLFFSADETEHNEDIQKFYTRFDAKRKSKKLITRGIAPTKLRKLFKKRKSLEMKFVNHPIPENTGICNNKMAIITWGNKPRAILISSKSVVSKQTKFFNEIWNK